MILSYSDGIHDLFTLATIGLMESLGTLANKNQWETMHKLRFGQAKNEQENHISNQFAIIQQLQKEKK